MFTELKEIIIAVTKQTDNLPAEYREYVTKLTSPRTTAMNAYSRWVALKLSSSGSDSDKQGSDEHRDNPPVINDGDALTGDLLPRSHSIVDESPAASDKKTDSVTAPVSLPRL